MINLKKIGKKVWHNDELYAVHAVISPNKFDDFMILKQNSPDEIHEDGVTAPVLMLMLDCHNDSFYPDVPKVRQIMKRRAALRNQLDPLGAGREDERTLTEYWLRLFPRD